MTKGLPIEIIGAPRFALSAWLDKDRALLDPSYLKPTDHVALRPLWRKAFRALQRAREWIFCGYSFPPADLAARTLVGLAMADRANRRVVVVDPDRNVARRIARVMGQEVRHLECTAASWLVGRKGEIEETTAVAPLEGVGL